MSVTRPCIPLLALGLLAGCGDSAPPPEPAPSGGAAPTTGAEQPEPEPEPTVQVMRTTTPIPVPQPGTPREQLTEPVQQLWERVERTVAIRPPEPPAEATEEGIESWAKEQFRPFLEERITAMTEVQRTLAELQDVPPVERGLAAALFGYMNEDTAAAIRGAPVPESLAKDEELLGVYVETLTEAVRPIATQAARGYQLCVAAFEEHLDGPWAAYAHYCDERGAEVVQVYELAAEPDEGTGRGAGAEGDEGAPAEGDAETAPSTETEESPEPPDAASTEAAPQG